MSAKDKDKTSSNYDISHHKDTAHSQGARKTGEGCCEEERCLKGEDTCESSREILG